MVIGMPTYGRSFTLSNTAKFGVHSPASGGGKEGTYTKESGFLAYYEVLNSLTGGFWLVVNVVCFWCRCARCSIMVLRTSGMKR